jgi:hypothetical protein
MELAFGQDLLSDLPMHRRFQIMRAVVQAAQFLFC